MSNRRSPALAWLSVAAPMLILGCGGAGAGGGGSTGGTTTTGGGGGGPVFGGKNAASLAATFSVDVKTGKVSIVSQKGALGAGRSKPGMFTGNTIGFNSTVLTDLNTLGTGAKVMSVSLTNNSGSTIGVDANGAVSGLNVIFSAPVDTTGIVDERPNTVVATLAGSGGGYGDGIDSQAEFTLPSGVAVGTDGSVYVADYGNNRIRKIKGGYVSTLSGNGTSAETDGVATKASFKGPYGIAVNPVDGSVIVADINGNTIRRVTSTGLVNTIAGTGVAGGANGAGNVATFTSPTELAVDSKGNIYVSESSSNRIRKITLSGSPTSAANYTVTTFAGSGTAGLVDGNGAAAEFFKPYGLTADPSGNVFVADFDNDAIREIDPAGNVTTIAGTGVQSDLDGFGNAATFDNPIGIAYVNGALAVCESTGERVREVAPIPGAGVGKTAWVVETLAGTGSSGDVNGSGSNATFNTLDGIAASANATLYLADHGNDMIRRVNISTGTFPVGVPNISGSTDPATLSNPSSVADSSDLGSQSPSILYPGSLAPGQTGTAQPWDFIVPINVTSFQFQVIVEANTSEPVELQASQGSGSPGVDVRTLTGSQTISAFQDGSLSSSLFGSECFVAVDGSGNVYISDTVNNAIRRIDVSGMVTTIGGAGRTGAGSTNGAGNVSTFSSPFQLAVNSAGTEVFVADAGNNEVRRIALSGADPTVPTNWITTQIAGNSTAGYADGPGNSAQLNFPAGICLTQGGELYVSEYAGNRIRRIDSLGGDRSNAANWYVKIVAGDGTQLTGASGNTNGQGTAARFSNPHGLGCDLAGNVYVADQGNNLIRKIIPANTVSTFAGTPFQGYQDGAGNNAEFHGPTGVCADAGGYVYVADVSNGRIRRISPNGDVATVAGIATFGTNDGPGNTASFTLPLSVAISASGTLYVGSEEPAIRIIQTVQSSAAGPKQR